MARALAARGRRLRPTAAQALAAVTLAGAALRYWGVFHGFREGYLYHPDARFVVHTAWHHLLGAPWLAGRFGAVYGAMMWAAVWLVDALARFVGYPVAWTFEGIAGVASLLGATLGTATVPLVGLLGTRAYDRSTGLLAAALFAVAPLHAFQSHYPYRDVPMVFLLAVSLIASVAVLRHPTLGRVVLAGLAAVLTAAAKPAGALAFLPFGAACLLVAARARRRPVLVGIALAAVTAAVVLPAIGRRTVRAALNFAGHLAHPGFLAGAGRHLDTLVAWVGIPFLLATAVGILYALWRRRPVDWLFLAFLLPAAGAIARFRFSDERFHLLLLPVAAVLVARVVVEGWRQGRPRPLVRAGLGLAAAALVLAGAGRSAWHGWLLALPDTRAIAGGWFEAHVPRDTRVGMEEYYPLGLNEWPNARSLATRGRLAAELAAADLVVTSSVEHQRYFDAPRLYPRQLAFLSALPRHARLVKTVALTPLGFLHPDLAVYATRPPGTAPPVRLPLPRPYDHRWNRGVALLDAGPYDRDDRTIWLGGAQRHLVTLAAAEPVDEVLAIVLNGPAPSVLHLAVGWTAREAALGPGEWRTVRLRPRWPWPYRPALYGVEASLRPEGGWALVQLRSGAREIGEGLLGWARWEAALPYLERAAAARPADVETGLLLAGAYRQVQRAAAARGVLERLAGHAAPRLDAYRRLAAPELGPAEWERGFADVTGLDPAWLARALGQEFEAEDLVLKAGRHRADADASADRSLVFDRSRDPAGLLVNGPHVFHQPPGAYRAGIRLRAWDRAGPQPVAVVRVYAETRLLAEQAVSGADLGAGSGYVEVPVPYVHDRAHDRVAFQVAATGAASLAVDRIRITPDLRATLAAQLGRAFGDDR